jgi:hypothetical protein
MYVCAYAGMGMGMGMYIWRPIVLQMTEFLHVDE